ncbi:hypothetical protein Arub01_41700 [Actinomadura rubrobrunea]|uniref:Uncharacterized protein n=1 Tax=Actinomadura rubrobrunea TaxID=115335 RepID=A0A9W6UVR4_9ACTN|nr:hypothetical protein Arub01_41700 [Actinomadura rubrobrunea]
MTAPMVSGTWAAQVDVDEALKVLRARFPWAMAWHGEYTGSLWAAWRDRFGRVHMVEAADPAELGQRLEDAAWPSPHAPAGVPGAGGMTAGLWSPPAPERRPAPQPSAPPRGTRKTQRRRGLLARLLARVTHTDDWEW